LWIHGDLHPGNLLVSDGRLSAVIDFGDLAAGDPATDLSVAWMLLPQSARSTFRAAVRGELDSLDDDTWMRARGWALALGLAYLDASRDDEPMGALGRATIDAALNDNA
jgi:aminoglycoside phosphotransferase (APT) family kinase protein